MILMMVTYSSMTSMAHMQPEVLNIGTFELFKTKF